MWGGGSPDQMCCGWPWNETRFIRDVCSTALVARRPIRESHFGGLTRQVGQGKNDEYAYHTSPVHNLSTPR